MGLLGDLKSRVKETAAAQARKVVEKVAARANIPIHRSREERDRADIEAALAAGAPRFRVSAEAWDAARHRLSLLGNEGLGMIQARWTESELKLKAQITPWAAGMAGKGGLSTRQWQEVGEGLLTNWQSRGAEVAESWRLNWRELEEAWRRAGEAHADRVEADGWRQAAGDFDRAWQQRWESLQQDLQKQARLARGGVISIHEQVAGVNRAQLEKAAQTVENSILRAEAELWGVWGTNGALIRGVSRTVSEGRGTPDATYEEVFTRCRDDFDRGFRNTLADFESSWAGALDQLARSF